MKEYCLKLTPKVKAKLFEESDRDGTYSTDENCFVCYTHKKDETKDKSLVPYILTNKGGVDKIGFQIGKYGKCYIVVYPNGTKELIEKKLFENTYKNVNK